MAENDWRARARAEVARIAIVDAPLTTASLKVFPSLHPNTGHLHEPYLYSRTFYISNSKSWAA